MPPGQRPAFTLIELLVVLSIIALLIALLVPGLSGARTQSRSVVCLTNLRTLSHGWHMYADDHRDVLLPGRCAKEPGGTSGAANWYDVGNGLKYRPRWVATMGWYVGIFAFDGPSTSDDRQDYESRVYRCPQVPQWKDERNYAYGYNHQFLGNARKTNGRFHNFPVKRAHVRSFSRTVLGADCMGTAAGVQESRRSGYANDGTSLDAVGNHGWTLDPPRLTDRSDRGTGDPGSPRTAVDPRHQGKANTVFCDGHAASRTPERLGYGIAADGTFVDVGVSVHNALFSGKGADEDPPDLPG